MTYDLVESALSKSIEVVVNWSEYKDLETIAIDEIALKKGHNYYLTIISVKGKNGDLSVIAVLPDRLKETIKTFLESIPAPLRKAVKTFCADMYDGFVKAASEVFGNRVVVVDRYHISKLYREPLDHLRIEEVKQLKTQLTEEEYAKLEGMMWILRRNHECLSKEDKATLELMYAHSLLLKEAHKLALRLTQIFNTQVILKRL